ncbi:MAG TPA: exodeoxyribonuclease VII large subunit [Gaiellales bacterium]
MNAKPTPTTYGDRTVYSVAGFNQGVADWLGKLGNVWIEGELSELKRTDQWGLVYFCLKDETSTLRASMQRDRFDRIEPTPVVGDRVHVFGRGELWHRKGEFRFRAYAIEQFGLGQLLRRIEEVRLRLAGDGLFAQERKRPLPFLPRVVGLVCGSDAAAKRDVVETAEKRYPGVRFRIVEAAVQGAGAAVGVAAALRALDADPLVDVIVLARGGGSVEDLLPFSDEGLCRVVAECTTPVVTAIGHEQDTPLIDLVADVRAGTPSLAAKLVVPDHAAVCADLDRLAARAGRALEGRAATARRHLQLLVARPAFADPRSWITTRRTLLDGAAASLRRLPALRLEREAARLVNARDRLRVLGPGATLERGYAIVQDDAGAVVRAAEAVVVGQRVGVRLATGRLAARVEEVQP